jgi:two-component system sensor histidine kinase VicK
MLNFVVIVIAVIAVIVTWFYFKQKDKKADRLKSEFVSVVTHKFRTPITRIKWIIDTLNDNTTFQNKEDLLKDMGQAVQQVTEIIDLLTDFTSLAAKPASEYEPVSLRQLITTSIDRHGQQTREKQITFDLKVSNDVPSLLIEKNKIQFVIDVLIENAIKYTPAKGHIAVSLNRDGQKVIIGVNDNGIGISPVDLDLVFQRFWRSAEATKTNIGGMGLSLHTARAIVKNQGGRMWVESKGPGLGSTFYVQLEIKGYNFKFK